MDAHSRRLLAEARRSGRPTVPVLVLAGPEVIGELRALGGRIGSADRRTGHVRADVPVAAVDRIPDLPGVSAVQVLEDVERDDPAP
ncbi:hypothetical protein B0I33_102482 [Prauserella shujinwangii]|uniref:Uncharacterized protein n=1 Tax=Prauserella shujinwangii TaxID=1453103 RepID=A0A2T0M1B6_9PSEU|nr:hypothetical protein [Prauserella shujinwangii]PRX50361.1 hypothetical protein B0I33_102482 [Prauserella shujinwangii]